MAVPSPSGAMRETLEAARTLLARCATFQALVGATGDDAAELTADALTHISRDVIAKSDSATSITFPATRLWFTAEDSSQIGFGTTANTGIIRVEIMTEPDEDYAADPEEGEAWGLNVFGGIKGEIMAQQSGALDHLIVRRVDSEHVAQAEKSNSRDVLWILEFSIHWGLQ